MSVLRFTSRDDLDRLRTHLFAGPGERFAFMLCRWHATANGPILVVADVLCVDPGEVTVDPSGWSLSDAGLDQVLNTAARTGLTLVEAHNHAVGPPGFSRVDRAGLGPFANYVLDSFPDRPYAATVWAGDHTYGEWFERTGDITRKGVMRSVVVTDGRLEALTAPSDRPSEQPTAQRQLGVVGVTGQSTLGQLAVAIIGLGGTGSHMARTLAYLGVRHFILVDGDHVEDSNLNRLVTATPNDVNESKVELAASSILSIAPAAIVEIRASLINAGDGEPAASIAAADIIIGCIDDDGPRLLLNRLAIHTETPYIDVASGINLENGHIEAGGRIAFVLPAGACLACTTELDIDEVRAYFLTEQERRRALQHGYLNGHDEPSAAVVSLNGVIVHTAINELLCWVAGLRPPAPRIDIDLIGNNQPPGPRTGPRRGVERRSSCVECGDADA